MAERRENSVLFSLRELRNIEDERVKTEEEAERARIEAERRAKEEAIRLAREEEERKIREAEDRVRREREDQERAERDHQVRLHEAERRAQLDAAGKLEQARIEADARARIEAKKFPVGAVVGGVIGLIVLALGTMSYLVHQHNEELTQQRAAAQAKLESEQKRLQAEAAAQAAALKRELDDLNNQLKNANSDVERARIRQKMLEAQSGSAHKTAAATGKKDDKSKKTLDTKTNDPLGGLGL
jgi:colicin import membrane protein